MFFDRFSKNQIREETDIIEVPEKKAYVILGLVISNTTSSDIQVDVKINNTYIIKDAPLITGSSFVPIGSEQKLIMSEFDKLKVSATDFVDVYLSVAIKTY